MDKANHSEVLIVGGGVIGCSIAYECAKQGMQVTVLEAKQLGQGTSRAAAGMLAPTAERFSNKELMKFAYMSQGLFPNWAEQLWMDSEIDIELRWKGILIPVHSNQEKVDIGIALNDTLQAQTEVKCKGVRWVDLTSNSEIYPHITRSLHGLYELPHEGHVSPIQLTEALILASRRKGVLFREYQEVKKIVHAQGKVKGVETSEGLWTADSVVICSGVDSNQFNEQIGMQTNFHSVKGELAVVRMEHSFDSIVYGPGTYIVPKSRGHVFIGATSYPYCSDRKVRAGSIIDLMQNAISYVPSLYDAEIVTAWTGLRPATSDGLPYIGPVPHIQGLWMAAGHYRNGILLSAATAIGLAAWICEREMPWPWLKEFDPLRHTLTKEPSFI